MNTDSREGRLKEFVSSRVQSCPFVLLLAGVTVALLSAASAFGQTNGTLAFAGAEGFGRFATGGKGQETVHVSNLNDAGPGSFRDAVKKAGRMVVFDVGGIIRLNSNVSVNSDTTLSGDTAPAEGITIYGRSVSFSGRSNIVVQYLRFREGIQGERGKCSINISGGSNMTFDHCSIEWGRWDCLGLTQGSHDITFQNCIIGQGIDPQRFGCLADSVTNITFTHDLWIDNQSRNPKAKGRIQYINSVAYNWGVCGLVGGHSATDHFLDLVGNYFIAGPNSSGHFVGEFKGTDHVYQKDNQVDLNKNGKLDGRAVVIEDFGKGDSAPTIETNWMMGSAVGFKVEPASIAVSNVLANAGCSLHRDAVDKALIDEVKSFGARGTIVHAEK